jgi:hypothetical protein
MMKRSSAFKHLLSRRWRIIQEEQVPAARLPNQERSAVDYLRKCSGGWWSGIRIWDDKACQFISALPGESLEKRAVSGPVCRIPFRIACSDQILREWQYLLIYFPELYDVMTGKISVRDVIRNLYPAARIHTASGSLR